MTSSVFTIYFNIPGHEYKFRVKAVNAEGESDPLDASEPIIAKNPFGKWSLHLNILLYFSCIYFFGKLFHNLFFWLFLDKPGQPSTPEVKDWDKDRVELTWDPPAKDGGAKIQEYIIEKKRKGSTQWTKAATVDGDSTTGKATGLETGETYQFRVIAVNIAGPGEPSEATKPVLVKPRRCKNLIFCNNILFNVFISLMMFRI